MSIGRSSAAHFRIQSSENALDLECDPLTASRAWSRVQRKPEQILKVVNISRADRRLTEFPRERTSQHDSRSLLERCESDGDLVKGYLNGECTNRVALRFDSRVLGDQLVIPRQVCKLSDDEWRHEFTDRPAAARTS